MLIVVIELGLSSDPPCAPKNIIEKKNNAKK
jgi:hypothetical protein